MFSRLLLWARRNSKKAIALAVAPGLLALGVDVAISHYAGTETDNPLQFVPVAYSFAGFLVVVFGAIPRSRAVFAWTMRTVGALGFAVGAVGTVLHIIKLFEELAGDFSKASIEGALSVAPPVFAPLGFTGLGALLFFLASPRLLLRMKLGKVEKTGGEVLTLEVPREKATGS